jgi:hypothetical protein
LAPANVNGATGAKAILPDDAGATSAPHTSPTIIHPLPGPQVFPESVAVDAASGRYWATSVKDGAIFTGVVGSAAPAREFSPAGAGGRTIATGIAYAGARLAVAGRQTGKAFVYDARSGRRIARMRTGLPPERTWLDDVLRLSRDYTTAAVRGTITDPSFAFTTGAAVYRDRLTVVSSQFDTLGSPAAIRGTTPPKLPFWVSEIAAGTR